MNPIDRMVKGGDGALDFEPLARSRSPVLEFDQRLSLPGFDRILGSVAPDASLPGEEPVAPAAALPASFEKVLSAPRETFSRPRAEAPPVSSPLSRAPADAPELRRSPVNSSSAAPVAPVGEPLLPTAVRLPREPDGPMHAAADPPPVVAPTPRSEPPLAAPQVGERGAGNQEDALAPRPPSRPVPAIESVTVLPPLARIESVTRDLETTRVDFGSRAPAVDAFLTPTVRSPADAAMVFVEAPYPVNAAHLESPDSRPVDGAPSSPRVVIERLEVEIVAADPPAVASGAGDRIAPAPTAASVSRIGPLRSGRLAQSRFAIGR